MGLKFGTNTIATNGDYAKFGTNNLDIVKFSSTNVWEKQTTPTLSQPTEFEWSWYDNGGHVQGFFGFRNPNPVTVTASIYAYLENSIDSYEESYTVQIASNAWFDTDASGHSIGIDGETYDYLSIEIIFSATGYQDSPTFNYDE